MAEDDSPLVRDIWISDAVLHAMNEDSIFNNDHSFINDIEIDDKEGILSSSDLIFLNYTREYDTAPDAMSVDPILTNSALDVAHTSIYHNSQYQHVDSRYTTPIDSTYHSCLSLSFSNPPEPIYHVRYLSEITNSPVDGHVVNTKKKTKKNVSGRYLKGTHGRHVTIDLPINLPDYSDFYIRVTRLTVPYQNLSFIHPYPLFYSPPKRKTHSNVIIKSPSIYYKLNKEDVCSHSKQFPNIILTRLKQCHLKQITRLSLFDNSDITYPFIGDTPKAKIATYQLKKSQLDFRVVVRCPRTGDFIDANVSCRTNALLEEEGTECKKSLLSSAF